MTRVILVNRDELVPWVPRAQKAILVHKVTRAQSVLLAQQVKGA